MSQEQNTKLIHVLIAVNGKEISILDCAETVNNVQGSYKDKDILTINKETGKDSIIQFITKKIKENQSDDATVNDSTNQQNVSNLYQDTVSRRKEPHIDGTNKIELKPAETNQSKPQTQIKYDEYKPDAAYNRNKDKPDKFTDNDVMIYLSEIRRKNNGTVPDHLKRLHYDLYNAINNEDIKNNTEWSKKKDASGKEIKGTNGNKIDSEAKKIFDKIYEFELSKNNVTTSSYQKIKSDLDAAFLKIFSNKLIIPKVYLDALKSMKTAIDSHTEFKYPSNTDKDTIFNKDHIYSKDGNYNRMQTLTKYLNNTVFERFDEQIPDEGKYPPSINIKCKTTTQFLGTGNRKDDCFIKFTNSGSDEVIRFLKFISSIDTTLSNKYTPQTKKTTIKRR